MIALCRVAVRQIGQLLGRYKMKYSKDEIAKVKAELRLILKPGMTVYTKINHISRSGMSRSITPFLLIDNELSIQDSFKRRT
jgi:hypothetical protein